MFLTAKEPLLVHREQLEVRDIVKDLPNLEKELRSLLDFDYHLNKLKDRHEELEREMIEKHKREWDFLQTCHTETLEKYERQENQSTELLKRFGFES